MVIQIRHATVFDIDSIFAIEKKCFEEELRFQRNLFYLFLLGREGEIFLVAEETSPEGAKEIVGFIVTRLTRQNTYEILTINVEPGKQNQGIGTQLLLEFERILKLKVKDISELQSIPLELVVYEYNESAKHLYKKLGYKEVQRIPNYYTHNRTGIKMIKNLPLKD